MKSEALRQAQCKNEECRMQSAEWKTSTPSPRADLSREFTIRERGLKQRVSSE